MKLLHDAANSSMGYDKGSLVESVLQFVHTIIVFNFGKLFNDRLFKFNVIFFLRLLRNDKSPY